LGVGEVIALSEFSAVNLDSSIRQISTSSSYVYLSNSLSVTAKHRLAQFIRSFWVGGRERE
jgi:hypothetical protein